ncbi:hypothetical protein N781_05530 [Pontibacillus halophilus JSM 076056 = DSM 19796]|uniref:LAAC n=1 Tax=Pontibacillus halophilus JSM 076056 = DSM 19796 TaxID=1385510 RepID=A0A0A5GIU6_9BACI|nr:hypothetical protein N781_05530 [Pontibacillus halophilus JSM 076056 = DSM 19796]
MIDKLNLSKYEKITVLHQPDDYTVFDQLPTTLSAQHDAIFIFVMNIEEMKVNLQNVVEDESVLAQKGTVFFAYPKKGNKRYDSYIHRDEMFPALGINDDGYVSGSDIKFSRMVSMDDVFTVVGMKKEPKKVKKTSSPSQCVADYEDRIDEVKELLKDTPEQLSFFQQLTPGYQRDWARQIFSAKQQATRDKRAKQMIEILGQGYKSLDLYRREQK